MFYEKKIYISAEQCDYTVRMGNYQIFYLLQNAMSDGFEVFDCGNRGLGRRCNGYWAVTKTRLDIIRKPNWSEEVTVKSVYTDDGRVRVHIKTEISNLKGELLMKGCQELCVLDKDTHRPKRLSETCLPVAENKSEPMGKFEKFSFPDNVDSSYELTVRSQNIDMSRHVNNIEYIRMVMDLFTVEELCEKEVASMQVQYIGECREGDKLTCSRTDDNNISFLSVAKENKKAFEMKIEFK